MKLIAVIPTRKGSLRIKEKNTRYFGDSNLLEITIQKLLEIDQLYKIIVSSNDEHSEKICKKYDKIIYEQRDDIYCTSECKASVWNCELANIVLKHEGTHMMFCHCTCPFIQIDTYKNMIDLFYTEKSYDSFVSCHKLQKHLWEEKNGNYLPLNYELHDVPRSQDINPIYIPTWGCVITKCTDILLSKSLIGTKPYFVYLNQFESMDLDTNIEFLTASIIANMGFTDTEDINQYVNTQIYNNCDLLDCTIRDGGYTNNWDFDDTFVKESHILAEKMGVNYFEIGFRNNLSSGKGKYYNISDDEINKLQLTSYPKICVMVTVDRFTLDTFIEKKNSPISMVRILLHRINNEYNFSKAIIISNDLLMKGYEVTINIANCESLTIIDIKNIKKMYRTLNNNIKCIYLADTFGNCRPKQITKYKILFGEVPLGFHSHNNSKKSTANTLQAMDDKYCMIDTCINGLGKNCGNCKTEDIAYYKINNFTYIKHYMNYISQFYNKDYDDICLEQLYFICGINNIHSDYIHFIKLKFPNDTYLDIVDKILVLCEYKTKYCFTNSSCNKILIDEIFA
jgi:CMP-N-acetylneuraminic acid synthetase